MSRNFSSRKWAAPDSKDSTLGTASIIRSQEFTATNQLLYKDHLSLK